MADNVSITPGSGAVIATDEVGARHFQLVKLAIGADGQATLVQMGEQAPSASIPVTLDTTLKRAIDQAAGASDAGIVLLAVRDDVLSTLVPVDGDYVPLRLTAEGALWVRYHSEPVGQPTQIVKTVPSMNVPEPVAAVATLFRRATIIGQRAPRTNNTDVVYLGWTASNNAQPYEVTPGTVHAIEAPYGQQYDLANLYIDVLSAGDGVIVWYS